MCYEPVKSLVGRIFLGIVCTYKCNDHLVSGGCSTVRSHILGILSSRIASLSTLTSDFDKISFIGQELKDCDLHYLHISTIEHVYRAPSISKVPSPNSHIATEGVLVWPFSRYWYRPVIMRDSWVSAHDCKLRASVKLLV
jgi:hypothetical protein